MAKDPICGMEVNSREAISVEKDGQRFFFCSQHCKDKFIKEFGLSEDAACAPLAKKGILKNKLFIISCLSILVVVISFFVPFLVPLRKSFLVYLKAIWWAVALGLFLGGVIDYYVPQEYISKILSRRSPLTIINAVFLGFLLSACSHGILALSIQLHKKGASNPAVVAFLLASPWANLTITMMLIALFGIKGIFVIVAAIIVAVNTGFVYMFLERKGLIESNKNTLDIPEQFSILKNFQERVKNYRFSLASDLKGISSGTMALADMVLWWIIIGIFMASLAGAYIPSHIFHRFMGPTFLGLLVTLAFATVIEVCSEGSSPLAFEIYRQTGALGNSLVFLMAGVATDYTEIGLLWTNVGKRVALWLPVVTVPQIIVIGYIANLVFR